MKNLSIVAIVLMVALFLFSVIGWFGNIIWTLHQTVLAPLVIGIAGIFIFPLGILHYWFF